VAKFGARMSFKHTIKMKDHENLENAWTVPKAYYTSDEIFDIEKETLFAKSWICVAHVSEVAKKNSFITRELIGEKLIIVRGRDNILRGFYNVCPHRGHQLLSEESGSIKGTITCPYHAWAFKLDGELSFANNADNVEQFDPERMSLSTFHVNEYAGFIYVNLDANEAKNIEQQLPNLASQMTSAMPDIKNLKLAARFMDRTQSNWKAIVDNYLECYHCPTNHVSFAESVSIDKYQHILYDNWSIQIGEAKASNASYQFEDSIKNPSFDGYWIWPCTMFNMPPGQDFMTVIYELPINANETLQYYDIYFFNEELTQYQKDLIDWYRDVFRPEDLRLVESVQQGLKSRGYRNQGRIMTDKQRSGLSEHGVAYFHRLLARFYLNEV